MEHNTVNYISVLNPCFFRDESFFFSPFLSVGHTRLSNVLYYGGSLVSIFCGTWSPLSQKSCSGGGQFSAEPESTRNRVERCGHSINRGSRLGWAQAKEGRAILQVTLMLAAWALPTSWLLVPQRKGPNHVWRGSLSLSLWLLLSSHWAPKTPLNN